MKRSLFILITICMLAALPVSAMMKPELMLGVQGIDGEMRENVLARLRIEREEVNDSVNAAGVSHFAKVSVAAVRAAIAPYGYFKPVVTTEIRHEANVWRIIYHVQPGRPVRVRSIQIKVVGGGSDNAKILRTIKEFPLKAGDIFNSTIYTSARDKLFDVASNQGYIKAIARDAKIVVNTDTFTADIHLTLETNQRYYFGKMTFDQNVYSEEFINRFNIFNRNEPFSSNKLLRYQQDMNNSRYFKQVIVIPDLDHANDVYVPISTSIVPVNYRRYAFGLGYGTFTGPRFTAGMNFRRLTDSGHALDALLKLSTVLSGLGFKYYIPGQDPLNEQWILGLNYQKFVPKNGTSNSKTLTFGYSRKMHHWQLAANMNYLWERYKITNQPSRDSQLLYPNLNLTYLKADNVVQPTYGHSLNLVLQGASSDLISTTSFLQGEVKGKLFMTPVSFAHIILRGDVGYTLVHDLNDLPLSMRFFAGGMTSVRGFADSSIGPGKYLGVASIEYRNHIAYDVSGAVFYDIGTAANSFDTPLNRGAGVGLVYESVVGPIKLYVARALSKEGHPYQIEFSMGPEF